MSSTLFLAAGMVVTGSINSLTAKWADVTTAKGTDGREKNFDHPFFQAACMFLGEMLCIVAFGYQWYTHRPAPQDERLLAPTDSEKELDEMQTSENFSSFYFLPAAMCDMAGTSLTYIGLNWTYVSVAQMLRGSVCIFTGVLSVVFLKRKLDLMHWAGMFLVLVGLLLVGLSSVIGPSDSKGAPHPLWGDIITVCAQVVVAIQMVYEEKVLTKFKVPALKAVGLEGVFGFFILSLLLIPFYFIPGISSNRLEDAPDAFAQMGNSVIIPIALVMNVFSIAFFNFFGISVTKQISATTRMVLDSLRTVVIWGFSLAVGWQEFYWLQVVGFVILLAGTMVYNKVVPAWMMFGQVKYDLDQAPEDDLLVNDRGGVTYGRPDPHIEGAAGYQPA